MNILLAIFPMLMAGAAMPSNAAPPATAFIFYAQSQPSPDLYPRLFPIIRADVPTEDQPTLLVGSDVLRGVTYPNIISVKLLGHCDAPSPGDHASSTGPLGWVVKVSGNIQPFIYIDCDRIHQVLRPAYTGVRKPERRQLLAQAIANVLLHEWSHISTQSAAHNSRGLMQPALTVEDLISTTNDRNLATR